MFLKTRSMCAGRLAGFVPLLIVLSSAASSTSRPGGRSPGQGSPLSEERSKTKAERSCPA